MTIDAGGHVLFANRAAEEIFGHPISALIGEKLTRILPHGPPIADLLREPAAGEPGSRQPMVEVRGQFGKLKPEKTTVEIARV